MGGADGYGVGMTKRRGVDYTVNLISFERRLAVTEQKSAKGDAQEINLEEVGKLIEALEQDLTRVRSGSEDMQRLRDEVETLKNVLNSPVRRHHWVRDGLHSVRTGLEEKLDSAIAESMKVSQYISEIGRILGL